MVNVEILFEWDPGEIILIQPYYEEVKPPLHNTVNEGSHRT